MNDRISEPLLPHSIIDKGPKDETNHIKSHDMVFAPLDLSPRMCDVLAMLFTRMRAEDWFVDRDLEKGIQAQPRYTFTAKEIGEFLHMEAKHVATLLKLPSQKLAELTAGIVNENGDFVYAPLFAKIEYKNRRYTIVPNNELRESYIAKAKSNGYALINNSLYLSLSDTNSKKLLDLLSRFKTGNKLYPQSITQLQKTFGVIGPDNKVKKPSYLSLNRFLNRVLEPALQKIADNPESNNLIRLLTSSTGKLGYDLIKDGNEPKIKFLYEWKNCFTDEEITEASSRIESLVQEELKLQSKNRHLNLEQLYELKSCCEIVATDSEDMRNLISHIYSKTLSMIEDSQRATDTDDATIPDSEKIDKFKNRMAIMIEKGLF